uniref:Immunoglobulin domain-containing protein n=1 Tax=Terrapene triunguis TaxID=2587831 RepID=A0A674JC68_9SAUR
KPDPALNLTNAAADETELTGILGGSVTFPLRISAAQKFKNGAWSVNTKSLVTVTAGKPPRVLVFDPSYEGRLRFSDESYSLQITDLRMEDTGSYTVEFSTDKEQFAYREFTLHVSSKCWGRGIPEGAWNPPCSGNSQDGRENVTYSWSNAPSSVLSTDSIVHIPQRHQAAREDVTCMARAPDGNSSRRTVSPKDFCAGNALRRETLERAGIGSPLSQSPVVISLTSEVAAPCSNPFSHPGEDPHHGATRYKGRPRQPAPKREFPAESPQQRQAAKGEDAPSRQHLPLTSLGAPCPVRISLYLSVPIHRTGHPGARLRLVNLSGVPGPSESESAAPSIPTFLCDPSPRGSSCASPSCVSSVRQMEQ